MRRGPEGGRGQLAARGGRQAGQCHPREGWWRVEKPARSPPLRPSLFCFLRDRRGGGTIFGRTRLRPHRSRISACRRERVAARLARVLARVPGGWACSGKPTLISVARQRDTRGVLAPERALSTCRHGPVEPPAFLLGTFRMNLHTRRTPLREGVPRGRMPAARTPSTRSSARDGRGL